MDRNMDLYLKSWMNFPPPSLKDTAMENDRTRVRDNNSNHVFSTSDSRLLTTPTQSKTKAPYQYQPYNDYFGLSNMINNLAVSDPIPTGTSGRRMTTTVTDSDDFHRNGIETEMDDFDRVVYRMRWQGQTSPSGSPPTPSSSISPASSSPPVSSPIGLSSNTPTTSTLGLNVAIYELYRERQIREQLEAQVATYRQLIHGHGQLRNHGIPSPAPPSPPMKKAANGTGSGGGRSRHNSGGQSVCVFCRNNGEPVSRYTGHVLKDSTGRVTCPILRAYKCPYCGASGDTAHTKTYCPVAIQMAAGGIQPVSVVIKADRAKRKITRPLMTGAHYAAI